jgi:NADH:ubiquinone oxidoreductase subunit 5 (subunit L)/multisubunit Na+/H+ antiporter MnhA subunit
MAWFAILAPLSACAGLGVLLLSGRAVPERTVTRTTALSLLAAWLAAVVLFARYVTCGELQLELGRWFSAGHYAFVISIKIDQLSASMLLIASSLGALIGRFSFRYLHRERGFTRFFLLLALFQLGMTLTVLADTLDLIFLGWELVAISSTLLIAFFQERREPARNAMWAFCTYRACDLGLAIAAMLLFHYAGSSSLHELFGMADWPRGASNLPTSVATQIGLFLLLAAIGKSAQFPFGAWLSRAMEGPTPSSAIFYGALSIHAGAYLLLRCAPLLAQSPVASGAVVAVGGVTMLQATVTARVQSDVKSRLAFAAMSQVGLMFVEIGLGFYELALWHMLGHATLRAWQFLRAPSALDQARVRVTAAGSVRPYFAGVSARLVPARPRAMLYRLSLERFHLESLVLWGASALLTLSKHLDHAERRWERLLSGWPEQAHRKKGSRQSAPLPRRADP